MVALVRLPENPVSYYPEEPNRRLFTRRSVNLSVEARRLDHSLAARRMPRLNLEVRDLSLSGMSALSDVPLNFGEHVSVDLPPQAGLRGWQAFGRIVRCEPSGMGYRVAVEFDPLPAA